MKHGSVTVSQGKVYVCTYLCSLSGGGVDYGPINCNPLVFSGTDSLECCNIPINDDNLVETTESFTVSLSTTASASDATLINPVQATVSITDNDIAFMRFLQSAYSVFENTGPLPVTLVLDPFGGSGTGPDSITQDIVEQIIARVEAGDTAIGK